MSIHPGYSGQEFLPGEPVAASALRKQLHRNLFVQVDGGITAENVPTCARWAPTSSSRAARSSAWRTFRAPTGGSSKLCDEPP